MPLSRRGLAYWAAATVLAALITLVNQGWVARATIYASRYETDRARLHEAITHNRLPAGVATWNELGADSTNIRPVAVWAAELLRRATGRPVRQAYIVLETLAVFACCLALCGLMARLVGPGFGLLALFYFGCVLPLSYYLHHFHPWDKPALALWMAAIACVYTRRWFALALVLPVAVATAFSIVVFPGLVFLAERRRSGLAKATGLALVFAAITLSAYGALLWSLGSSHSPWTTAALVSHNLEHIARYGLVYPPLLGLGLPVLLSAIGYATAGSFAKACAEFGAAFGALLFCLTFFEEFRVLLPLVPLFLPAAASGLIRCTAAVDPSLAAEVERSLGSNYWAPPRGTDFA